MTPIPPILLRILGQAALAAATGAAILGWTRWNRRRAENSAKTWPSTYASIHTGTATPIPNTTRWAATLTYSYFIDEYRSGTYVSDFPNEDSAWDFVRQLKDQRIPLRYNPSHPDKSVIEESVLRTVPIPQFTQ